MTENNAVMDKQTSLCFNNIDIGNFLKTTIYLRRCNKQIVKYSTLSVKLRHFSKFVYKLGTKVVLKNHTIKPIEHLQVSLVVI